MHENDGILEPQRIMPHLFSQHATRESNFTSCHHCTCIPHWHNYTTDFLSVLGQFYKLCQTQPLQPKYSDFSSRSPYKIKPSCFQLETGLGYPLWSDVQTQAHRTNIFRAFWAQHMKPNFCQTDPAHAQIKHFPSSQW